MSPRQYYVGSPEAFRLLSHVIYEWVSVGQTAAVGCVHWDSNPKQKEEFEQHPHVSKLGTVHHPLHKNVKAALLGQAGALGEKTDEFKQALLAAGVTEADATIEMLEKLAEKFGGLSLHA